MSKKCFNDLLDEKWSKMWTWETFFIIFSGYNIPKSLMCYGRKKFCWILACYFRQICFQNIGINFFEKMLKLTEGFSVTGKFLPVKFTPEDCPLPPYNKLPFDLGLRFATGLGLGEIFQWAIFLVPYFLWG